MHPIIAIRLNPIINHALPFRRARERSPINVYDCSLLFVDCFGEILDEFFDPEYFEGGPENEQEIRPSSEVGGDEGRCVE